MKPNTFEFSEQQRLDLVDLTALEPVQLRIRPWVAFIILTQLQLALRHPENRGVSASIAQDFARLQLEPIAGATPALRELIKLGWDPNHDVR